MRVDLRRFLFVGATSLKSDFIQAAQKAGIIHFIEDSKQEDLSEETKNLMEAIKILHAFTPEAVLTGVQLDVVEKIVDKILTQFKALKHCEEQLEVVDTEKKELAPFGAFDPSQLKRIEEKGGLSVQFFALKRGIEAPSGFVFINKGEELDNYLYIGKTKIHLPSGIEVSTEKSLKEVEEEQIALQKKHQEIFKNLDHLTAYREVLLDKLVESLNKDAYSKALKLGKDGVEGKAFSLLGWVPSNEVGALEELANRSGIFLQEVKLKENETVPTYLKNEKWARVGQDLVGIYDTPSSGDDDPSLWVLVFFTLFFSMIISDAGYGLIFLLIALFIRWKVPSLQGLKKRVLNLFTLLSCGCIVWGILANGYFGMPIDLDSPLRKVSIVHWLTEKKAEYHFEQKDAVFADFAKKYPAILEAKNSDEFLRASQVQGENRTYYPIVDRFADQILLELALLVGTVHILFSMGRYAGRNWALFGWILFLIGGYLYVSPSLGYTSILNFGFGMGKGLMATLGEEMALVGLGVMFVLALIQHRLKGILEIMTVITILADILSYLRLYALGLAGGIMSRTIFEMTENMPIFFAIIVMILAHTVNMGLGVMGGVIHGLRLNFLEWYHYSFEGGGKPFKPLKELKRDH